MRGAGCATAREGTRPLAGVVNVIRFGASPATAGREVLMSDDLREKFDSEVRASGLQVSGRDEELLYAMWLEHLPQRETLRAAVPRPDEEPLR